MSAEATSLGAVLHSAPDGDSPRSRRIILVTCCLALVLTALDATIVNIALPAIRSDLHASVAELQWSIDAYTVVVASFLLLAGSIADRFGRRKTFQVGLLAAYGIFGVGLGAVNAPITNTAVSGMPRSHAGLASAVASTSRQVGASLGVALAGALAGTGIESAHRPDFAAATHAFFWVSVALGLSIVVLGIASTGARARASAAHVASVLEPHSDPLS